MHHMGGVLSGEIGEIQETTEAEGTRKTTGLEWLWRVARGKGEDAQVLTQRNTLVEKTRDPLDTDRKAFGKGSSARSVLAYLCDPKLMDKFVITNGLTSTCRGNPADAASMRSDAAACTGCSRQNWG
jgi:hypothetical protein